MGAYQQPYFVIDTETGGLPQSLKKKATLEVALTELAVTVVSNDLKIVESKSWVIKPYLEGLIYDPNAAKISGIDKKFAEENGTPIEQVFNEFKALFKKYVKGKSKAYFVAQNEDFDIPFLEGFFELNKTEFKEFFRGERIDTMALSRHKWPTETKHNLQVIVERFGVPYVESHRAETDTVMTAKVLIEFLNLLRGEATKIEQKDEPKIERKRPKFEF